MLASFDASFINNERHQGNRSFPLEIGKIYKARILSINNGILFFSINDQIFKTSYLNLKTNSPFIFLKVLDNKGIYRFELIKENVLFEQDQNPKIEFLSLLKEKYSNSLIESLLSKNNIVEQGNNFKDFQSLVEIFQKMAYVIQDNEYHSLMKIDENRYFHVEIKQIQVGSYFFSLNFELEGKKYLFVKGYYQKSKGKINVNFITNSNDFYSKVFDAQLELSKLKPEYKWLCTRRYEK